MRLFSFFGMCGEGGDERYRVRNYFVFIFDIILIFNNIRCLYFFIISLLFRDIYDKRYVIVNL